LTRRTERRLLAGVADGVAGFLDLPLIAVRIAFVLLTVAGGVGLAVYVLLWVFLPQQNGTSFRDDARSQAQLIGLVLLGAVTLSVLGSVDLIPGGLTTAALVAAVAGVTVVWQQADQAQRRRWTASATEGRWALTRLAAGGLLLVAGLVGFLASRGELANARAGLLSTVVVVGGLVLVSSPWWLSLASELQLERTVRIRTQERAEVAAHLHDSVLQTLTLIQKAADSPSEVARLARRQERELRSWLYAGQAAAGSLSAALGRMCGDVEGAHGVPVELVVVGDCDVDERVGAVVAATREAVVNAAKHSGAPSVDVYAEVEPGTVSVFVRDRGRGFDPSTVPTDRHGLSGSVVGRMERHGGTASIRSTVGTGTEVRLELPRG
jgi:signal transduction histidine kinase